MRPAEGLTSHGMSSPQAAPVVPAADSPPGRTDPTRVTTRVAGARYPQAAPGSWWRDRWLWGQVAVQALLFLFFGALTVSPVAPRHPWQSALMGLGLAACFLGLILQRWFVWAGLAVVAASLVACGMSACGQHPLLYGVVVYEARYIGAYVPRYERQLLASLWGGSMAAVIWANIANLGTATFVPGDGSVEAYALQFLFFAVVIFVSVGFGALLGHRVRQRDAELETLRASAQLAAVTERNRIAREMHDIVAHTLTVVIAQADGGRYAGQRDPAKALEALDTIGTHSREALVTMRGLLSVLRDPVEARSRMLSPGVSGIPDLVEDARRAGVRVTLEVEGQPHQLDDLRGLTAYRVVQEALTNVLKHAGQVEALVRLMWQEKVLVMDVDNAPGALTAPSGGNGLRGLAERLQVHGGSVWTGPSQRYPGGWHLRADLPLVR